MKVIKRFLSIGNKLSTDFLVGMFSVSVLFFGYSFLFVSDLLVFSDKALYEVKIIILVISVLFFLISTFLLADRLEYLEELEDKQK